MAGLALGGQNLKHATHMAGLAVNQIVLTGQRKARDQMIESGGIGNHGCRRSRGDEPEGRNQQTQQRQHPDQTVRRAPLHSLNCPTPCIHKRPQIHCLSATAASVSCNDE